MRRPFLALATVALLVVANAAPMAAQGDPSDESGEAQVLFVLSATNGTADDQTLTLEGAPSVVYFTDRPERRAGQVALSAFAADWDSGDGSFADDPPNAVLSMLVDGDVEDIVVELTSIDVGDDDSARFGYRTIDGPSMPDEFGPASLFVDDSAINIDVFLYNCSMGVDGAVCTLE